MSYLRERLSSVALIACAVTIMIGAATPVFADNRLVAPGGAVPPTCLADFNKRANDFKGPVYPEIQSAVAASEAAKQNDTIYVCAGVYVVPVNITPYAVQIQGDDQAILRPTALPAATPNRAPGLGTTLIYPMLWFHDIKGGNVMITNLTVDGSNLPTCGAPCQEVGVLGQNAQGQLQGMAVRNINITGGTGTDGFGIFLQSGPNQETEVQLQFNSVHDYLTDGIIVNEVGTHADMQNNSVHGLGELATVAQGGVQVGFGAQSHVQNNVSSGNTGPAPHCQNTPSSVNFVINEPSVLPGGGDVHLENNVSQLAEIGIGDLTTNSHVQNNLISESLCAGVYVAANNVQVQNNSINHTCNPAQGAVCPAGSPSTAIFVVSGSNNQVGNNLINEAPYGVASLSSTTQANNEVEFNVGIPFAGTFKQFQLKLHR